MDLSDRWVVGGRGLVFVVSLVAGAPACGNASHSGNSAANGNASSTTTTTTTATSAATTTGAATTTSAGGAETSSNTGSSVDAASSSATSAADGAAGGSGGSASTNGVDSAGSADETSEQSAVGSGGAASTAATATTYMVCKSGGGDFEFCLTHEEMEAQARYGSNLRPRDPPLSDDEIEAAWDQNGCMDHSLIGESACCNPAVEPGEPRGDQCCYIACTGELCCNMTTGGF